MLELFELVINQVITELPSEFRSRLENVAIVVEEWPSPAQLEAVSSNPRTLLFGLHQKASLHPDKITIFARPILMVSRDLEDLKLRIKNTLLHEIGHYFGMSESKLRSIEYQNHLV